MTLLELQVALERRGIGAFTVHVESGRWRVIAVGAEVSTTAGLAAALQGLLAAVPEEPRRS